MYKVFTLGSNIPSAYATNTYFGNAKILRSGGRDITEVSLQIIAAGGKIISTTISHTGATVIKWTPASVPRI